MKKRNILLGLGSLAAVVAPIVAVVSCGSTKPGSSAKGTDATPQSNIISVPRADLTIAAPVTKQGYTASEVDDFMYKALTNNNGANAWAGAWDVYKVTVPNSTHAINFSVDHAANLPTDFVNELITRWAKYTNYGYGILTLENIFLTNKQMGSAGWGGAAKDILVQTGEFKHDGSDNVVKQNIFDTLQHEYGHHETSALIDPNGVQQVNDLVAHNVIGTTMHNNAVANPVAEQTRLVNLMNGKTMEDVLAKAYGATDKYQYNRAVAVDATSGKSFMMDAGYHLVGMEWLNRPMNILELMPWDAADKATLYAFPDALKYQIGESEKMFEDNGAYTAAAKNLVAQYGKYVYGYDGYGIKVTPWHVQGFSNTPFNFVKTTANNVTKVTTVNSVVSHYLTKNNLFEEPTVLNNAYAFDAVIATGSAYPVSDITFYEDTNHNGSFDEGTDKEVQVAHTIK